MAARGNAAAVTAAAAAAARAGGRVRTGRSSDRLGGRCSVCHERAVCAVRARSGAGKRGGAGTRGGGGEQASGPRAARRTGDRQAGDGRIVTAARDRRDEPSSLARPLLTSKASGARLSVSGGGRHVARREGDKCASYGSLFIGQSSGTQVETEAKHDGFEPGTSNAREI